MFSSSDLKGNVASIQKKKKWNWIILVTTTCILHIAFVHTQARACGRTALIFADNRLATICALRHSTHCRQMWLTALFFHPDVVPLFCPVLHKSIPACIQHSVFAWFCNGQHSRRKERRLELKNSRHICCVTFPLLRRKLFCHGQVGFSGRPLLTETWEFDFQPSLNGVWCPKGIRISNKYMGFLWGCSTCTGANIQSGSPEEDGWNAESSSLLWIPKKPMKRVAQNRIHLTLPSSCGRSSFHKVGCQPCEMNSF